MDTMTAMKHLRKRYSIRRKELKEQTRKLLIVRYGAESGLVTDKMVEAVVTETWGS